MEIILLTVLIIAGIGAIAGAILSFAAVKMAVPENETAKEIEGVLSGANCGACGYAGCSGYANALAEGEVTDIALCSPGGAQTSDKIAEILGVEKQEFVKRVGFVHCKGSWDETEQSMQYHGLKSCSAANQLYAGIGACPYGCIGLGDCAAVCEYDAVKVENGVATIDEEKCAACGKCVSACPKRLISLVKVDDPAVVILCKNYDKGALTIKECQVGCIGCKKCEKICEHEAITVTNFKAVLHRSKCIGCGKCAEVCPRGCIIYVK